MKESKQRLKKGLQRLAELVERLSEELAGSAEAATDPAERSRLCGDLERLIRSSVALRKLMQELQPRGKADAAETLVQLVAEHSGDENKP